MLDYANCADIMPIMLYAPAMLLCQFLCWHNPLTPNWEALDCAIRALVTMPVEYPPHLARSGSHYIARASGLLHVHLSTGIRNYNIDITSLKVQLVP